MREVKETSHNRGGHELEGDAAVRPRRSSRGLQSSTQVPKSRAPSKQRQRDLVISTRTLEDNYQYSQGERDIMKCRFIDVGYKQLIRVLRSQIGPFIFLVLCDVGIFGNNTKPRGIDPEQANVPRLVHSLRTFVK